MSRYILKRFLYMIPMLIAVVLLVFLIMSLTPGDPATSVLPMTTPQYVKDAYNERVGFTGTLAERFMRYVKGFATGNVTSYVTGNNVFDEIADFIPLTFTFGTVSFLISAIIGIALGIFSAIKQYSFLDTSVTVLAVVFASVPSFFVAICLILLFAVKWGLLPSYGMESLRSFILPVSTMVLATVPMLSRMTRSSMLEVLNQDFIRTARAKGCSEKRTIWKHALKNASLPIVTLLVTGFASILGGSVIIEQIFTLPGLGMYMLTAMNKKNVPAVMTCALLLSFVFMVCMVLLDICYAAIDPRIRMRYKK